MTPIPRRKALRLACGAAAAFALPGVRAQSLPETGRIVVGFPPAGAPDMIARRLAEQLSGKLAKTVVVENKPGSAGRAAVEFVKGAPSDGTTLLLNPAGVVAINPHTYKKLGYEPFKDFAGLSLACTIDLGFGIGPAVPDSVKTLADFAAWAKANPGKASFGSPAAGASPHFVGDALARRMGLEMAHVPYRGGAPAVADLMSGQIAAVVLTLGDMINYAKAGKMRLLATTGPRRSRFAPELPTFTELGVPGLEMRDWFGVYLPGAPSADTVAKVAPVVRAAASSTAYVQALAGANYEAASSSPQELDKMGHQDFERWAPIVKASGFQADA